MKNRHPVHKGALTAVLATVLGLPAAHSAEVYLQAEEFQKTIEYGAAAQSRSVAIVNAGFELPDCDLGGVDCPNSLFTNGNIAGWSVAGPAGVFEAGNHAPAQIAATEGDQVAYSNGGSISQVLGEVLAAGTTYTLTVDVGDRADTGFPGYTVGLYADGVLLAEESSLAPVTGWLTSELSYTATVDDAQLGQAIEVRLSGNGAQIEFDNVQLVAEETAAVMTMWGYSECEAGFVNCSAPSSPGPVIDLVANDASGLTINLRNTLPAATSIMIVGQENDVTGATRVDGRLRSFVAEVAGAVSPAPTAINVLNSSFESPDCDVAGACGGGTYSTGNVIADWNVTSGGVFDPQAFNPAILVPTDGDQVAYNGNNSTISQVLADTVVADTTYTLMVDVGDRTDASFATYSVGLYAGGVALATDNNSQTPPNGGWITSTVTYTASAGDPAIGAPLEIRLQSTGQQAEFDNVRLSAAGAATISTGTYQWPDLRPGAYLYHSGSHVQLQVQMGLYGAVVQDAQGCGEANCAYPDVAYDSQEVMIFSEIDPSLHDPVPRPANATVNGYRPQFFLVNGAPYDGTPPAASGSTGDRILIRALNAGLDNRSMQLLGGYFEVLGEDGHRAPVSKTLFNTLLPAAKSMDLLFVPADAGTYPFYDRRLKLVNGPVHGGGIFRPIVIN